MSGGALAQDQASLAAALGELLEQLPPAQGAAAIKAVGHRIVHGGDHFRSAVVLDAQVEHELEKLRRLAPSITARP